MKNTSLILLFTLFCSSFVWAQKRAVDHPDFEAKVAENKDTQNRNLAFEKIIKEVMSQKRRKDMEEYKRFVKDEAYAQAFINTMKRMTGVGD